MAKRRFISKYEKDLLNFAAKGFLFASMLVAPNVGQIAKLFPKKSKRQHFYIKKRLNRLIDSNIIYLGEEKICLSKKGEKLLKSSQIYDLEILQNDIENWDGVWHLISYDVPNNKSTKRDYFRYKLNVWGFTMIQKSLWLYPYSCGEEIAILAQNLGITPYVIIMNTRHIPNESKFLKLYNLENSFKPENDEN